VQGRECKSAQDQKVGETGGLTRITKFQGSFAQQTDALFAAFAMNISFGQEERVR